MNTLPFCLAILAFAFASPAYGGRMLDLAGPAELRTAAQPDATEAPVTDALDDEETQPEGNPDLLPEAAEDDDGEFALAETPAAPPTRWKWTAALGLGVSADDNIYLRSDHKVSGQLFTIGGNFHLNWGLKKDDSYLMLAYAPSLILFAGNSGADAFDQKGALSAQWRMTKLTLGATLSAQTLSGGDVDVGDRAQRFLWQVGLSAAYDYSTKTSFEITLSPNASDYSKYLDSIEWMNGNWIDYQITPKTRVGAGVTLGYLKAQGGSAQTYQQALVRVSNPVTAKIVFRASGGLELRQLSNGDGTQSTPVFHAGLDYDLSERTQISLEASRRIYSSASLAGQNFVATGASSTVRQHLFDRFSASLSGGYEDAQYMAADGTAAGSRHDQYFFARPSLSFAFRKWMNLELYYEYRRNNSTTAASSFESNVAGAQASFAY